jgi:hypothetical protein
MVLTEPRRSRTRDQQQYFRATTTPATPGDKVKDNVKTTNIDPASYLTEVEGAGEGLFVLACHSYHIRTPAISPSVPARLAGVLVGAHSNNVNLLWRTPHAT